MPSLTKPAAVLMASLLLTASHCDARQVGIHARQITPTLTPTPTQAPSSCAAYSGSCYTYTSTTQAPSCPSYTPNPHAVCPALAPELLLGIIETITVPCSTACCPTTGTTYVTTACPTSAQDCTIWTEWVTKTTGCAPPSSSSATGTGTGTGMMTTVMSDGGGVSGGGIMVESEYGTETGGV